MIGIGFPSHSAITRHVDILVPGSSQHCLRKLDYPITRGISREGNTLTG